MDKRSLEILSHSYFKTPDYKYFKEQLENDFNIEKDCEIAFKGKMA